MVGGGKGGGVWGRFFVFFVFVFAFVFVFEKRKSFGPLCVIAPGGGSVQ